MKKLDITTERGSVLTGVLFDAQNADTVVIAITGIHGNFYSNPFYYNIGATLNGGGNDWLLERTLQLHRRRYFRLSELRREKL